jgi:surfactin synthase thioesterase subunit
LAIELLGDPEVPRAFFGHSMGGSIAYQVVLRAKELGGSHLEHLILSSCAPPCLSQVDSRPYSASDFWLLLYDMIYLGGVPRRLAEDEALLRFAVEAYRRDLEFLEGAARLRWGPIDAPVSYFGGRDDRSLPRRPEDLWSAVVQRPVEASSFDGGHFFFVGAEAELCAALRRLVATGTRA